MNDEDIKLINKKLDWIARMILVNQGRYTYQSNLEEFKELFWNDRNG